MTQMVHIIDADDTLLSLSDDHYGAYDGWRVIAEANGIRNWGMATPLAMRPGTPVGSRIVIPQLSGER